jgi:hypothetical protein
MLSRHSPVHRLIYGYVWMREIIATCVDGVLRNLAENRQGGADFRRDFLPRSASLSLSCLPSEIGSSFAPVCACTPRIPKLSFCAPQARCGFVRPFSKLARRRADVVRPRRPLCVRSTSSRRTRLLVSRVDSRLWLSKVRPPSSGPACCVNVAATGAVIGGSFEWPAKKRPACSALMLFVACLCLLPTLITPSIITSGSS